MRVMQKYFLAIVPEGEFQERVTHLKLEIKDRYQAKYALKSPAHITLKMPFIYNEAKEDKLKKMLQSFIGAYSPLSITIKGVRTFGKRVIYLGVEAGPELYEFQSALKTFCKRELNLVDELSDRNFHPHITISFKDIKEAHFQNILNYSIEVDLFEKLIETHIVLLKKSKGRWILCDKMKLGL